MKNIILTCSLFLATFLISPNLTAGDCLEKEIWVSEKDSIESINVQYPKSCDSVVVDKSALVRLEEILKYIEYPSYGKRANIQGQVLIRVLIDKEGRIRKYVILESPHVEFIPTVINAVKSSKFKAAIYQNKTINSWITIPVIFKLT